MSTEDYCRDLILQVVDVVWDKIKEEKLFDEEHHGHRCKDYVAEERSKLSPLFDRTSDSKYRVISHIAAKNIWQIEVATQRDPFACGYHTFHNALEGLKATLAHDEANIHHFLQRVKDPVVYQLRRDRLYKHLHARVIELNEGMYPWSISNLRVGVMERAYMYWLLENSPYIKHLGPDALVALPDLCQGSLTNLVMEPAQLHQMEEIFARFRTKSNHSQAFLVGSTNHWFAFVINKIDGEYEGLFLDSRNKDLLEKEIFKLKEMVKAHYDNSARIGWPINNRPWRETIMLQSLLDTQFAIDLLYDCCSGTKGFSATVLKMHITGLIHDYQSHVTSNPLQVEFQVEVISWLKDRWPVKMMQSSLRRIDAIGIRHLDVETRDMFRQWIDTTRDSLKSQVEIQDERIPDFINLLNDFSKWIDSEPNSRF